MVKMSRTSIELAQIAPETPLPRPSSVVLKSERKNGSEEDINQAVISPPANAVAAEVEAPGRTTTAIVLSSVVCTTGVSTLLAGLVTVGLPTMAKDLGLDTAMLLW